MKQIVLSLLLAMICIGNAFASSDNILPNWALGGFVRADGVNPIVKPNDQTTFKCPMKQTTVKWECADTFNPAAVYKDGKICILYRAEDDPSAGIGGRTSRIGYAESADGLHIDYRSPTPVMYPDQSEMSKKYEWHGGTEDPRVVEAEVDGKHIYVMTYTAWNNSTPRLSIATSTDLKTWTHQGPAFLKAINGKFANLACKSGSIVTKIKDGRLQAAKVTVNGEEKYFMYWGEEWVCGATSDDLVNWTPIVDGNNNLKYLVRPRKGYFDSRLTECGPPAVITDDGIILLYNGKNKSGSEGDASYAANTYAAGQMLFSLDNPLQLKDRLDKPFFRPMTNFERSGQYADGTVFIEGLVYHNDKWYLYYGCADSFVGVAVYDPATSAHEGDPIVTKQVPEGVINQQHTIGTGKLRSFVSSYSGYTNADECPDYMNMSYIYPNRKWCDTSTDQPWLVMELTGIYNINRVVLRDVANREANCGNVPEYWIYTSTTSTDDWTLVAHGENVGNLGEKNITFPSTDARYVKLVVRRGIRPSGVADNAIRLYGIDIYGQKVKEIERPDHLLSYGKTFLAASQGSVPTGSAMNLLTGSASKDHAWRPTLASPETDPYRYAVIDLESLCLIDSFAIYDARSIQGGVTNMNAYQIYVSQERPDLSLITSTGDSNSCWTLVADRKNQGAQNIKVENMPEPVKARYVKLVFPRTTRRMNSVSNPYIRAFNVYGKIYDGGTTAIENPNITTNNTFSDDNTYTINGMRLPKGVFLPKTIYIKNGRKIIKR